jgi:FAD/FMN-containing dehydrogenase
VGVRRDLAARDSATIGGTIGTNAGGIRVCCYGMTRRQVLGVEAVLPDGSVVSHLSGFAKDNTGYDIAGLMVGSEGTLGVVTAARLGLRRPPRASAVALIGV